MTRSRDNSWKTKTGQSGPEAEENSAAGPMVAYTGEATPLLSGKKQSSISRNGAKLFLYSLLGVSIFGFVCGNLYMHFSNCPLYPRTMDAIRRGWEKEEVQHDIVREQWRLEKQDHTVVEEKWKVDKEWHDREVARRTRDEEERQERVRKEWVLESERHKRETEEYDEEMKRKEREAQERQEKVRKEWDGEMHEHEQEVARRVREEEMRRGSERRNWRREMEDHDRIVEERRKREEGERLKLNMFWADVEAHRCTTFATREYTAQLMNLPTTWEHRVEACKATPLEVHGISYLPKSCEDRGPGVVFGRWEINQHEPDCASFWLWYKDKGCTSALSGKRRVEHYLENLPEGGDWREFCATTPAHFYGMEFMGAQECFQSDGGTYGHWEIDDAECR